MSKLDRMSPEGGIEKIIAEQAGNELSDEEAAEEFLKRRSGYEERVNKIAEEKDIKAENLIEYDASVENTLRHPMWPYGERAANSDMVSEMMDDGDEVLEGNIDGRHYKIRVSHGNRGVGIITSMVDGEPLDAEEAEEIVYKYAKVARDRSDWIKFEQKKQKMITELGSLLHDEWRAPREIKDSDGKGQAHFEERIKVLVKTESGGEKWFDETKVPANAQEIKRQDIANTPFEKLEPKWQSENQAAAEVAMAEVFRAVESGQALDEAFVEGASEAIHVKWLERNNWVYDPNYGNPDLAKPYEELSEEEKEKDRAQVRKAIKIFEANK